MKPEEYVPCVVDKEEVVQIILETDLTVMLEWKSASIKKTCLVLICHKDSKNRGFPRSPILRLLRICKYKHSSLSPTIPFDTIIIVRIRSASNFPMCPDSPRSSYDAYDRYDISQLGHCKEHQHH